VSASGLSITSPTIIGLVTGIRSREELKDQARYSIFLKGEDSTRLVEIIDDREGGSTVLRGIFHLKHTLSI
jgi:hypothetical protein